MRVGNVPIRIFFSHFCSICKCSFRIYIACIFKSWNIVQKHAIGIFTDPKIYPQKWCNFFLKKNSENVSLFSQKYIPL